VAAAVRGGLLTIEEVFERYQMTIEELGTWQYAYQKRSGVPVFHAHRWDPLTDLAGAKCRRLSEPRLSQSGESSRARGDRHEATSQTELWPVTAGLAVDVDFKTVEFEGRRIRLTGGEYRVLELALHKGVAVTGKMLQDQIPKRAKEPNSKSIEVYICGLAQEARGGR
jgi:hypothetical protein